MVSLAYPAESPPLRLAAAPGLALWWCSTAAADDAVEVLQGWLSPAEHARAARLALPALARRYVVGRAALRYVLADLLQQAPAEIAIIRGARGRPQLADATNLDFNVSNTRQVALIAVTTMPGARVGVDIEHRDRELRHEGLARKFCTPAEYASLDVLAGDARRHRFLRLWTCKEAMSKATGDALGAPLRRLDVELEPILRLAGGPPPYPPADWSLLAASVPGDYFASVAVWRSGATLGAGRTR